MFEGAIWDKLSKCIFEIYKLAEKNEGNFKIYKNHEGDLPQKLSEPNL